MNNSNDRTGKKAGKVNSKENDLRILPPQLISDEPCLHRQGSVVSGNKPGLCKDKKIINVGFLGNNVKKMFSSKNYSHRRNDFVLFTPPTRHDGKSSYIAFYAKDPATGRLKRKKYMLDRYEKGHDRDFMAAHITANIMNRLVQGWNPWTSDQGVRGHVRFDEVLDRYERSITQLHNKGTLKHKTWLDYMSRLRILKYYMETNNIQVTYCFQVNTAFFVDYLDYVLLDRDDGARTRNNHRTWLSTFCTWMVQHQYLEKNPIVDIPILREEEKFRQPLSPTDLHLLKNHLERTNKHYLLAVMFMYYTAIRPSEMIHLKIRDIDIARQTVYVYGPNSKNRRGEPVILNDKIIRLMIELDTFNHHSDCYIFGKGFMPSEHRTYSAIFRNEWFRLRERLGFPKSYQFYSLKDSGLRDLVKAEGAQAARDQARHRDVSTTNKYLQGRDKILNEGTKHFEGEL